MYANSKSISASQHFSYVQTLTPSHFFQSALKSRLGTVGENQQGILMVSTYSPFHLWEGCHLSINHPLYDSYCNFNHTLHVEIFFFKDDIQHADVGVVPETSSGV